MIIHTDPSIRFALGSTVAKDGPDSSAMSCCHPMTNREGSYPKVSAFQAERSPRSVECAKIPSPLVTNNHSVFLTPFFRKIPVINLDPRHIPEEGNTSLKKGGRVSQKPSCGGDDTFSWLPLYHPNIESLPISYGWSYLGSILFIFFGFSTMATPNGRRKFFGLFSLGYKNCQFLLLFFVRCAISEITVGEVRK